MAMTYLPKELFLNQEIILIYDFACDARAYCLRREPLLFKNTLFLVDRLHKPGHLCPATFDTNSYPSLERIRTILVEVLNGQIKPFARTLNNMTLSNAVSTLQFVFAEINELINDRLRGENMDP